MSLAEIVSTRTTFDGVTVYLHADGSVSDRRCVQRGKLPVTTMWRAWGDVCTYTHAELPEMIRAAKRPPTRAARRVLYQEPRTLSNGLVVWRNVYGKGVTP